MATIPILAVENVRKTYARGVFSRKPTFRLEADFRIDRPAVVGVMGPNGSGKTTLFELVTGSNLPTSGRVLCMGRDIHRVRSDERDRIAIHYHQSYQVRRFRRRRPNFLLERAEHEYPMVHLFDEPQFNTQDGYIGFMLDFFRRLRAEGRLVFVCLHPHESYHLEILREVCERYIFIREGRLSHAPDFEGLLSDRHVRAYLGGLVPDIA